MPGQRPLSILLGHRRRHPVVVTDLEAVGTPREGEVPLGRHLGHPARGDPRPGTTRVDEHLDVGRLHASTAPAARRAAPAASQLASCRHFVQPLGQRVPAEGGALDAHRELHDALEGGQLAELVEVDGLGLLGLAVLAQQGLVDRHHPLEGVDELAHLVERLALDGRGHQRGRRLADGTAGAVDLQIGQLAVLDQKADHDLVTAEGVEALDPVGRGDSSSPRFRGER